MSPGVGGIGLASFFADVGHGVPTALLPGSLGWHRPDVVFALVVPGRGASSC